MTDHVQNRYGAPVTDLPKNSFGYPVRNGPFSPQAWFAVLRGDRFAVVGLPFDPGFDEILEETPGV